MARSPLPGDRAARGDRLSPRSEISMRTISSATIRRAAGPTQRATPMRALTVIPGQSGSARLEDVDEPPAEDGPVLVEVMAVGVCGTDHEIVGGRYGWAPPGRDRLILGHESLGRVVEAPGDSGLKPGDL